MVTDFVEISLFVLKWLLSSLTSHLVQIIDRLEKDRAC